MKAEKLLSVVIVGRNDDYLGNYRYRLQTALDFLARNLRAIGRLNDVEVVFVDWNSQGKTLADEVVLTDDAAALCRFIIVSPQVAKARNMQVSFFTTCAVNAGVRRSRSEFIMLADSDSLMPLPSLKSLLEILDGTLPTFGPADKLIYPIPRHQIPGALAARKPNAPAWAEILKRISASRRKELPAGDCLGGFSAAQLMHRDLWFDLRGYNERLDRAWGWSDNELMLRVTARYGWMDVGYYGVVAYHIEHHASVGNDKLRDPTSINKMMVTDEPAPSGDGWGLGDYTLPEVRVRGAGAGPSKPAYEPMISDLHASGALGKALSNADVAALSSRVAHHKRCGGARDAMNDEAVAMGTAFMLSAYPRNALHFGQLRWPLILMLVEANPGIDLFLARPWPAGEIGASQPGDPGMLSMLLANSTYRGFARILNGPPAQALEALAASDPAAAEIDFAVIQRDDLETAFESVFPAVLDRLSPGGAVLLIDERGRTPSDAANQAVFLGRQLETFHARANSGPHVFLQSPKERVRGEDFILHSLPSQKAHLICKKPAKLSAAAIAAE